MRVAVIGAGIIGRLRAQAIRQGTNAELVGVMDPVRENAEEAAKGSSATIATGLDEVLDLDPDAVVISSPVHYHEEAVVGALERGAHVLCEKPLSNTVASCRRIVDSAVSNDRVLAVGFNHRYYPSIKYIRSVLEAGTIGDLDHVRVFGGHDGLGNFRADWQYKAPESGGGAMMDVGIHMTDLARHLVGEITQVYGIQSNRIWKVDGSEDNAVAVFQTEGGVPIAYEATWSEWKGYRFYVEVYGDKGMVRGYYAPMFNLLVTQTEPGGPRATKRLFYPQIILREKLKSWTSTALISFADELRDFSAMISGAENVPLATGFDGLRAVEVAEAVRRSSQTGEPVASMSVPRSDA